MFTRDAPRIILNITLWLRVYAKLARGFVKLGVRPVTGFLLAYARNTITCNGLALGLRPPNSNSTVIGVRLSMVRVTVSS